MFRIDTKNATADHKFQEYPATILSPEWLNSVQEELANAVESVGIALDQEQKTNNTQLLEAIQRRNHKTYQTTDHFELKQGSTWGPIFRVFRPVFSLLMPPFYGYAHLIRTDGLPHSRNVLVTRQTFYYREIRHVAQVGHEVTNTLAPRIVPIDEIHDELTALKKLGYWRYEYCMRCRAHHDDPGKAECFKRNGIKPFPVQIMTTVIRMESQIKRWPHAQG